MKTQTMKTPPITVSNLRLAAQKAVLQGEYVDAAKLVVAANIMESEGKGRGRRGGVVVEGKFKRLK